MNGRVMTTLVLLVAASAALTTGASAQEGLVIPSAGDIQAAAVERAGVEAGPNQFGTSGWFEKTIPATAWVGRGSDNTLAYGDPGFVKIATGDTFWAPLELPPGTEVQKVCLYAYDNTSAGYLDLAWTVVTMAASPTLDLVAYANSGVTATPGFHWLCAQPASPVRIRAYSIDDDERYQHYLTVEASSTVLYWGGAVVTWRRVISPAPATATFPNDVPTSHPYFRFVEALAASGITAGCATGSYCPDATLTRGQMAVFLSAALGLYWPY